MELEKELELERLRSDIRANQIKFKAEIESLTNDHARENWNYIKKLRK
ncbi:unnamed protein product [Tenebrio molitor]|nr:unnamed protein product [Tenebrio molitor]